MTINIRNGFVAEGLTASPSTPIPGDIFQLVCQAVERTMHNEACELAISGDAEGLSTFGRSLAVEEGRLLENIVITLARRNAENKVLSGLRLPVLESALAIIETNDSEKLTSLCLDPDGKSKRSYYPDLVLANSARSEAIIVDVKRSVASYLAGSKMTELKVRMQAAGLALPDILWREYNRTAVTSVSVAIIDGSKQDSDVSEGIWPLTRLDELVGVIGAGVTAQSAIALFRRDVSKFWNSSIRRESLEKRSEEAFASVDAAPTAKVKRRRRTPHQPGTTRTLSVGLFRPARALPH